MKEEEHLALELFVSQDEVACIFKVSPRTLENWRCKGIGPKHIKIGKFVRYRMSDVISYINSL